MAEGSFRSRAGPDARRDPFAFGFSVPGRSTPALRGLPPRDAAPAVPAPSLEAYGDLGLGHLDFLC